MTKPTFRNVLVSVDALTANGFAFATRLDNGQKVFIAQLLAARVNAQPGVTLSCDIVPGRPDAAAEWRAVVVKPAKQRLQPICTSESDRVIDDRILLVLHATGRAMTVGAIAETVFGRDLYTVGTTRAQKRLDYLHEVNQVLCATVFRADTPEGDEAEVYGLPEVFAGVAL